MLDISNFIDSHSEALKCHCKNKKLEAVHAVIKHILQNGRIMDEFMKYGGEMPEFRLSEYDKKHGCFYVNKP